LDRTTGTGQPEQHSRNSTARTGQPGQESRDRTSWTNCWDRAARIEKIEQAGQNIAAWEEKLGQDNQERAAGAGQPAQASQ
jgi:hypothetical protein